LLAWIRGHVKTGLLDELDISKNVQAKNRMGNYDALLVLEDSVSMCL